MKDNLHRARLVTVVTTVVLLGVIVMASFTTAPASAAPRPTRTPLGPTPTPSVAATYYVDCSAAANGNGTQASPWNNLATVNARTFAPGDNLVFKRGTTCTGFFYFSSAGT